MTPSAAPVMAESQSLSTLMVVEIERFVITNHNNHAADGGILQKSIGSTLLAGYADVKGYRVVAAPSQPRQPASIVLPGSSTAWAMTRLPKKRASRSEVRQGERARPGDWLFVAREPGGMVPLAAFAAAGAGATSTGAPSARIDRSPRITCSEPSIGFQA